MEEGITEQEMEELLRNATGTATIPDQKFSPHAFLHAVATATDTTKVGNLREEEVGIPKLSSRTLKELALFCRNIADEDSWGDYFEKRAEILTSTSLSKEAKLIDLAVMNRSEIANVSRRRVLKKNWRGKEQVVDEV